MRRRFFWDFKRKQYEEIYFYACIAFIVVYFLGDNLDLHNYLYDGSSELDFQAGYQL